MYIYTYKIFLKLKYAILVLVLQTQRAGLEWVLCGHKIEGVTRDSLPMKAVGPCDLSASLLALYHLLESISLFSVAVTGFWNFA